jgi:hypothetical protein
MRMHVFLQAGASLLLFSVGAIAPTCAKSRRQQQRQLRQLRQFPAAVGCRWQSRQSYAGCRVVCACCSSSGSYIGRTCWLSVQYGLVSRDVVVCSCVCLHHCGLCLLWAAPAVQMCVLRPA